MRNASVQRDGPAYAATVSRVRFVVTRQMWTHNSSSATHLAAPLDGSVSDLRAHYVSPLSARRWVDLCQDPEYGHAQLEAMTCAAIPGIIRAIRANSGGPLNGIQLTSLGSGDGSLDARLLRTLVGERLARSYVALDCSFELLRYAVAATSAVIATSPELSITAVCGDFTELPVDDMGWSSDDGPRLVMLTGLTLGNYDERFLLERIRPRLRACDYLLVDARLHNLAGQALNAISATERAALVRNYDIESVHRFVFSPLEQATLASARDVTFQFDLSRKLTTVPNAINIVITCADLRSQMRFTGERVSEASVELAVTTVYRYEELASWFGTAGFDIVWAESQSDLALFLLRANGSIA